MEFIFCFKSSPPKKKKSSLQWGLKKCKDTWTLRQGPLVLSTKSWPGFVMQTFDALWYISISSKRTSEKQKLYVLFWNPAKKMHSLRHCIQMSFPRSSWMLAQTEFIYQGETRFSSTANFLNKHEPLALSKIEQISRSCTSHSLLCYVKA